MAEGLSFLEFIESEGMLTEAMKRKRMVRDGKVVQKWKTTQPGTHRIEYDKNGNPHEVRMTAEEIRNREKGRRVGQKKADARETEKVKKQQMSMKVRKRTAGLKHYDKKFPDVNSEHDKSPKR